MNRMLVVAAGLIVSVIVLIWISMGNSSRVLFAIIGIAQAAVWITLLIEAIHRLAA